MAPSRTCTLCGKSQSDQARFCPSCGQPLPSFGTGQLPPAFTLQDKRYVVQRKLGQGGMGAVYEVTDQRLSNKRLALKELSEADLTDPRDKQAVRELFEAEAGMLASLSHPNIPQITDFFTENDKHYIVMEVVVGQTLEEALANQSGPFPEQKVREWGLQLCEVLAYLHARTPPVIFRDLKPANIMLTPVGQLVLVDFGIARLARPGKQRDTQVLLTPGFAPPEQYGRGQTDTRSDIYSLGVVLHHLLTRYDPTEDPLALPLVRRLNAAVSPAMEQIIKRATEVDPAQRYQRIQEVEAALVGSAATAPPSPARPTPVAVAPPVVPPAPPPAKPQKSQVKPQAAKKTPSLVSGCLAPVLKLIMGAACCYLCAFSLTTPRFSPAPSIAPPPPRPTRVVSPSVPAVVRATPTKVLRPTLLSDPPSLTPDTPLVAYTVGKEGEWQIYLADPISWTTWLLPGQPPNSAVPARVVGGDTRLAFRSDVSGHWQLYTIAPDGTDLQQLTSGEQDNFEPAWSPDGSQLAFTSERDGNHEIYLMNRDGSNVRRLTHSQEWDDDPSWSADGEWIVFESGGERHYEIYKIRVDGSEFTRLTFEGDSNSTPAWSPDGRWIAFERRVGNTYHIWLMEADGSHPQRLTKDGRLNLRPAWSPDGQAIAYTSNRDGEVAVWQMALDDTASLRRLSAGRGFDAAWLRR